jgi:ubiquinone/menaquinone biosynthesis C-methylase UbiE
MSYDKQQATHEFERWSLSYDRSILQLLLFRPSHQAMLRRISERCGDRPLKILDVGCGTGVFAARIREAFPKSRVCGVDLVRGMLHQGKARWKALAPHVQPVQGDSERLPFATGVFDILTCANSFHHYPHQDRALVEMHRVLRPGGRILLIDGYRDAPWGWFIYDVCVAGVEGAVHHCSSTRVRDLMTRAGFGEIHQKVHRGAAPFLFTEAVAKPKPAIVPAPHFSVGSMARNAAQAMSHSRDSAA